MKLICGLGNPGKEYDNTRHNIGFMIIDKYCKDESFSKKFNGLYCEKNIDGEKVIFLKPQSYMNLSGTVVKPFKDYFKITNDNILIIRDDLDLQLGHTRIKYDSSSGGDNGVKSIIEYLGQQNFYQYKVGISNDRSKDTKNYVLGRFSNKEMEIVTEIVDDSINVINAFIRGELTKTTDYRYGVNDETDNR